MGMSGLKKALIATAVFLVSAGTIIHTIGMATPEWSVYPYSERGPYTSCDTVSCGETSVITEDNMVEAVRGLTMTAMALGVFATIATILIWCKPDVNALPFVAAGLSIIAFIFILIAICIWASDVNEEVADLGYSFVLSIVGGIVILIGGIVAFVSGRAH